MNVFYTIFYISISAAVLAVLIKNHRPEIGVFVSVAAGCFVFLSLLPQLKEITETFSTISAQAGVDIVWISPVLKICGIAILGEWGVQLCRDAGEGAIASRLELGTKITILVMCMPVIKELLKVVSQIL